MIRKPLGLRPRTISLLALGAVLVFATAPAWAQPGGGRRGGQRGFGGFMGGSGRMYEPEFLRRDLTLMVDELTLDEGQRAVVETLLLDYEAAFAEAAAASRERFSELRPSTPEDEVRREKMRAVWTKMRAMRQELRDARRNAPGGEGIDEEMVKTVRAEMDALREHARELRPPRPQGEELEELIDRVTEIRREWNSTRRTLRTEFIANLQSVLSDEQAELWPSFDRFLRRQKSMSRARLSSEGVDLVLMLRQLGLSKDQIWELSPIIDEYSITMDQALRARNEHLDEAQDEVLKAMRDQDYDKARSVVRQEAQLRTRVRSINDQHLELFMVAVEESVAPVKSDELRTAFRREAFGRIHRGTSMQRSFDAAKGFEDLSDDQLTGIVGLEEAFLVDLTTRNTQLRRLTREQEPGEITERMDRIIEWRSRSESERRQGRGWRRDRAEREDPVRDAFTERTEMEKRYRTQLESLLTPEQIEQLPPPPRDRQRRGERGERTGRGGGDDADREARRAERLARMIKEFDADGDGVLDEAEHEKMRETMRERFGDRAPGPDSFHGPGGPGGGGGRGGGGGGGRGGGGGGGGGGRGGN